MIGSRTVLMVVLSLGMAGALSTPALAQAAGGGGRGGGAAGGGAGGRQRMDPAQMRERMMTQLKEALGATDEEWTALQPKVEKVMTAQQANRAGGGFGGAGRAGGRRGGAGGGGAPANANTPQSPVGVASQDLQSVLDNKDSTPEQVKDKLQALRDARTKARADLAAAQAELKELVTARQEAVLVERGMLE